MMFCIEVRGVNDLWHRMCPVMVAKAVAEETRNGKAYRFPTPVMIEVREPWCRVLEDPKRDCNHVFHLMESIWMLAGRNDVAFLDQFNSNMKNFSDNGNQFNAAYGHRWRNHFGQDQLLKAIERLRTNPTDRRVVINMWDPSDDMFNMTTKDVPCNLTMIPQVSPDGKLDLLTVNRSNDLVWGLCGANAVHLSMVHEFMTMALGLPMGTWRHLSTNLHYYDWHADLVKDTHVQPNYVWQTFPRRQMLLDGTDAETFLRECGEICDGKQEGFSSPFLEDTVEPVWASWREWKTGDKREAIEIASCIESDDWRIGIVHWYKRHIK